ncbi:MAG: AMP-binding protein [Pseudonocardiaceae bacterium]|nr:AMP-binding protein [Pseudonocardiaceae bacterium]
MRVIRCDGSPAAVTELRAALDVTLAGGPALAPIGTRDDPPATDPGPSQVVVTTSGATGEPKRVLLPTSALAASATATHARLGGPGHWLLALPAEHVAGLQVLVRAALAGTEPEVLDLRDGFDTAAFAAGAGRLMHRTSRSTGARCYTSLVPTQLQRMLDGEPAAVAAFDAVLLGGAAAPTGLVDRARDAGVAVVTTYGMSETCGGCVYDGYPLDGVRLRLSPARRIEVAGPVLATGYLGRPDDPTFRDGWLRTSDLGQWETDGTLRVLGRADDVIVTGGVNVAPADVEAVLDPMPGVWATCVVGLPDAQWGQRLVAAVVPADPSRPPDPADLLAAARGRLPGTHAPKQVVLLDALPLLGVGKPDRRAVADLLGGAPA